MGPVAMRSDHTVSEDDKDIFDAIEATQGPAMAPSWRSEPPAGERPASGAVSGPGPAFICDSGTGGSASVPLGIPGYPLQRRENGIYSNGVITAGNIVCPRFGNAAWSNVPLLNFGSGGVANAGGHVPLPTCGSGAVDFSCTGPGTGTHLSGPGWQLASPASKFQSAIIWDEYHDDVVMAWAAQEYEKNRHGQCAQSPVPQSLIRMFCKVYSIPFFLFFFFSAKYPHSAPDTGGQLQSRGGVATFKD